MTYDFKIGIYHGRLALAIYELTGNNNLQLNRKWLIRTCRFNKNIVYFNLPNGKYILYDQFLTYIKELGLNVYNSTYDVYNSCVYITNNAFDKLKFIGQLSNQIDQEEWLSNEVY